MIPSLSDQKEGQSGLITCLSVNPANTDVFAAGSYSKQLALYSESDMNQVSSAALPVSEFVINCCSAKPN